MYKSFTAEEYKKELNLPLDYKIEGFVSYGGWNDEKHTHDILECLDNLGVKNTSRTLEGFFSHILEVTIENKIYWFAIAYGGAVLSEYVHLACIFGSKQNIHTGSCGGLFSEMNSLDFIIPTFTYGKESSASMYDRENVNFKYYPDENLSKIIESKFENLYKVHKGPVISCHAMLGETGEDVQSWSEQGYYAVEMETATMFAVSKHFNVPSSSFMYVGDNLIKGQVAGDESHILEKEQRENVRINMYKMAIEIILNK